MKRYDLYDSMVTLARNRHASRRRRERMREWTTARLERFARVVRRVEAAGEIAYRRRGHHGWEWQQALTKFQDEILRLVEQERRNGTVRQMGRIFP